MRRRHAGAVLGLALVLVLSATAPAGVAGQQSGQVIGQPTLGFTSSSGALAPGTTTTVDLTVTNRGRINRAGPEQYENRVTTARGLILKVGSDDSPIRVNAGQIAVGNVPTGSVPTGGLSVTVPDGTAPGTYELPVEYSYEQTRIVSYGDGNPEYRDTTITRQGTLEVTVDDRPTFEVVNRSSEALVGQPGRVAVTLKNTGTQTARDATVSISAGNSAMTFAGGTGSASTYAGTWKQGETKTVAFEATVAESGDAGEYSADLSVGYTDDAGIDESSRSISVGIPVGDEQAFAFRDVRSTLRAGYEGQLRGELVNEGPNTVRNPVAVLRSGSDSVTITSSEEAIPTLDPGESAPVNFTVDVSSSAQAARQQFELVVDYDNALGDRLQSSVLRPSVQVHPPQDRFEITVHNNTVPAGEGRVVDIEVTNRGDEVVRNVRAKAYLESPLSSSDDEGIIDRLEPGETGTVSIQLGAASSALEKAYPMSMDFQYDLPDGDTEVSDTYPVSIRVNRDDSGGGFPLLPVVGVLALGVGGLVWYRRR